MHIGLEILPGATGLGITLTSPMLPAFLVSKLLHLTDMLLQAPFHQIICTVNSCLTKEYPSRLHAIHSLIQLQIFYWSLWLLIKLSLFPPLLFRLQVLLPPLLLLPRFLCPSREWRLKCLHLLVWQQPQTTASKLLKYSFCVRQTFSDGIRLFL